MLKVERVELIKELAKENEIISWDRLQEHLNASKATVRRDIDELEKTGLVKRTRGGVIFCDENANREPSNELRFHINPDAKAKIARAAAALVKDHEFLMLDSGSTVIELTRRLPKHMQLGVATYALPVAMEMADSDTIDVYLTGGELRKHFVSCHGYMADQMMAQFHATTCFLGADAVSAEDGITGYNSIDISIKRIMIEHSDRVVLLADHSKFKNHAFMHLAPIEAVDIVITDSETDEACIAALREKNIQVIIAE